jgi:hypothetical protein
MLPGSPSLPFGGRVHRAGGCTAEVDRRRLAGESGMGQEQSQRHPLGPRKRIAGGSSPRAVVLKSEPGHTVSRAGAWENGKGLTMPRLRGLCGTCSDRKDR